MSEGRHERVQILRTRVVFIYQDGFVCFHKVLGEHLGEKL